ncbi:MAG: hypothetical protein FMNOHCHN_01545 [Ignavibacteriaceae bacterium]|nr:hypothetical protein [Ignavibacteriaceae bacterium]
MWCVEKVRTVIAVIFVMNMKKLNCDVGDICEFHAAHMGV